MRELRIRLHAPRRYGHFERDARFVLSDGGQHDGFAEAVAYARQMVDEGAQIIDVGGESTRPGSAEVSVEEELARVLDVVRQLADLGLCVSIDTRHAEVARACVEAGAAIINDVTGFRDPAMVEVAKNCDAGLVVMHMLGRPATMQNDPHYDDVVAEVKEYLGGQAAMLEAAGIARERICVDPALASAKPRVRPWSSCNFHEFNRLGYPRWSPFRAKLYRLRVWHKRARAADEASAQEALMACELGASVVRAHNVPETMKALKTCVPM